jgi:hypothetical protein
MHVFVYKKSSLGRASDDIYNNDDHDRDVSSAAVVRKSHCSHMHLNKHIIQFVFHLDLHTEEFRVP